MNTLKLLFLTFSVFLIPYSCSSTNNKVKLVTTKQGDIEGRVVTLPINRSPKGVMDAKVSIFLGIPFATPPTGSLRYMPPVASTPWKGVKNAHRFAPVCPQQFPKQMHNRSIALRIMSEARLRNMHELKKALESQSEDCLYLNVYAPESR